MKPILAVMIGGLIIMMSCVTAFAETGNAVIRATTEGSTISGTAVLTDAPQGLQVNVRVTGVSPGKHGLHVHQYGSCEEAGNAAGSHFNPDSVPHGFLPLDGLQKAHPGDLGNIDVGQDGTGSLSVVLAGVTLGSGTYSIGGRAIILHANVDDFSQPTGNAGGRIGCGPILLTTE